MTVTEAGPDAWSYGRWAAIIPACSLISAGRLFPESNPVAGLQSGAPRPTDIVLHQQSRVLEIAFHDGQRFRLPWDYLYSLGVNQASLWKQYLERLKKAGVTREP